MSGCGCSCAACSCRPLQVGQRHSRTGQLQEQCRAGDPVAAAMGRPAESQPLCQCAPRSCGSCNCTGAGNSQTCVATPFCRSGRLHISPDRRHNPPVAAPRWCGPPPLLPPCPRRPTARLSHWPRPQQGPAGSLCSMQPPPSGACAQRHCAGGRGPCSLRGSCSSSEGGMGDRALLHLSLTPWLLHQQEGCVCLLQQSQHRWRWGSVCSCSRDGWAG